MVLTGTGLTDAQSWVQILPPPLSGYETWPNYLSSPSFHCLMCNMRNKDLPLRRPQGLMHCFARTHSPGSEHGNPCPSLKGRCSLCPPAPRAWVRLMNWHHRAFAARDCPTTSLLWSPPGRHCLGLPEGSGRSFFSLAGFEMLHFFKITMLLSDFKSGCLGVCFSYFLQFTFEMFYN